MNKKIFFFDVDGTLLPSVIGGKISEETIYAINELKKNYPVFIATGKSESMIKKEIKYFQSENHITTNGQKIRYQNQIIYENQFKEEEIKKWVQLASSKGVMIGFQGDQETYFLKENINYEKLVSEFTHLHIDIPEVSEEVIKDYKVFQILIIGDREVVKTMNVPGFKKFTWGFNGHDILPEKASKDNSIKNVMNIFGDDYQIFSFGDGLNDYEMLKNADVGVAMGNAVSAVKEVADFVTDDVEDNGVYNFLVKEKIISEKK